MKKLYFLNEDEKNRILNLHGNARKRQYLSEQAASSEWSPGPKGDKTWEYQFKDGKWFARKKGQTQEYDISTNTKYKESVKILNDLYPEAIKPASTNKQQIITKTTDTTKQIQVLLGLDPTGVMDTGLLQKINDKLNGGGTSSTPATSSSAPATSSSAPATSSSAPATSSSTPAYNLNIDPNIGKDGINFNPMTPEQIAQGVQSATPPKLPTRDELIAKAKADLKAARKMK